jgi:hypothetical protein
MDTDSTNRVTMFKTVSAYLSEEIAVWDVMAPMKTAVTLFKGQIAAIDDAAQKQEAPTGATDNKAAARDALEDVLFLASEALGVVAHSSDDHDLAALTAVTPTSLRRMGAEELSNRAAAVVREAEARKLELAHLLVTQTNLDELNQALADFNAAKTAPRMATAARAVHTESLEDLIRAANGTLRQQIDRMVSLFARTDPEFVAGYHNARVIVDRAASHSTTKPTAPPPTPA